MEGEGEVDNAFLERPLRSPDANMWRKGAGITKATQTKIKSVTEADDTCRHVYYLDKGITGE